VRELKLKLCPFCGEKPVIEQEDIYCECGICMSLGSREQDTGVIERWNARVGDNDEK